MSLVFISYSTKDEHLAKGLYNATSMAGIDTFLAGISIEPGSKWTEVIFEQLKKAKCIFFLASKNSVNSPTVQQELGASIVQKKTVIPLLVDITPEDLPGWIDRSQAIDLQSKPEILHAAIAKIAKEIKEDKFWAGVIVGAIVAGLLVIIARQT